MVERGKVGGCWTSIKSTFAFFKPNGEKRPTLIVLPCSPRKDLEQSQISLEFLGGILRPQRLDGGGLEQFGKDVGLRAGGSIDDDVGDKARRGGAVGVGQMDEGLESLLGLSMYLVHEAVCRLSELTEWEVGVGWCGMVSEMVTAWVRGILTEISKNTLLAMPWTIRGCCCCQCSSGCGGDDDGCVCTGCKHRRQSVSTPEYAIGSMIFV